MQNKFVWCGIMILALAFFVGLTADNFGTAGEVPSKQPEQTLSTPDSAGGAAQVNQLKKLVAKMTRIEEKQERIAQAVETLVASSWEYKVDALKGGASRANLEALLAQNGKDGYVFVQQTSDGLFIFRRRIVAKAKESR